MGKGKEKRKEGQSIGHWVVEILSSQDVKLRTSLSLPGPNPHSAFWLPLGDLLPLPCEVQSEWIPRLPLNSQGLVVVVVGSLSPSEISFSLIYSLGLQSLGEDTA